MQHLGHRTTRRHLGCGRAEVPIEETTGRLCGEDERGGKSFESGPWLWLLAMFLEVDCFDRDE